MKEFETVLAEQEAAHEKRERLRMAESMEVKRAARAEKEEAAARRRVAVGVLLATAWIVVGGSIINQAAAAKIERAETAAAEAEERAEAAEERAERFAAEVESLRAELWRMDELMEQGNADGEVAHEPMPDAEYIPAANEEPKAVYLAAADKPAWEYLGEFHIYHYCACEKCCGKTDGITRTGTKATAGRTVSVDPAVIPLGSEVLIGDHVYIAEDTGVAGRSIDIFVNNHEEALALGTYLAGVSWR